MQVDGRCTGEASATEHERTLVGIRLLGKPSDYPVQPRCSSWMVAPLPPRLRVALHRDAIGVYDILAPAEQPQAKLWLVVEYERMGDGFCGDYRPAPVHREGGKRNG